MEYIAYCFRCKTKRPVKDPEIVKMKTGMEAVKGKCVECDGGLYKILPKKKTETPVETKQE